METAMPLALRAPGIGKGRGVVEPGGLSFRAAGPDDVHAVASLQADSWQRHYRGAFSDAFLDGDITGFLLPLWTDRLSRPEPRARAILAEQDGQLAGPAYTLLDQAPTWGKVYASPASCPSCSARMARARGSG